MRKAKDPPPNSNLNSSSSRSRSNTPTQAVRDNLPKAPKFNRKRKAKKVLISAICSKMTHLNKIHRAIDMAAPYQRRVELPKSPLTTTRMLSWTTSWRWTILEVKTMTVEKMKMICLELGWGLEMAAPTSTKWCEDLPLTNQDSSIPFSLPLLNQRSNNLWRLHLLLCLLKSQWCLLCLSHQWSLQASSLRLSQWHHHLWIQ